MIDKKLATILAMVVIIFITGCFVKFSGYASKRQETVTVARVIDGDTLELANSKHIRLIGIDSPEKGQQYYTESTDALKKMTEGRTVILEGDVSNTDGRGRLLRYVFVGDMFVNLEMVRQGYATARIISPDEKYKAELMEAEAEAREKELGIWKPSTSPYADRIEMSTFHWNAKGDDNDNLNDEYVTFKNACDLEIDMTRWTVYDDSFHTYTFTAFILSPRAKVTLHSGSGVDNTTDIYWDGKWPVWNNDGDSLQMRDSDGMLVIAHKYAGWEKS